MTRLNTDFVIVVNRKFLINELGGAHPVGAAGFTLAVAQEIFRRKNLLGFLLYDRQEQGKPRIERESVHGLKAIRMSFNFDVATAEVMMLIREAIADLQHDSPAPVSLPILYYQSNTLLCYTPPEIPYIVTHHGPFASEIVRLFGKDFASEAFLGGEAKVNHLSARQSEGVEHLKFAARGLAMEISEVQRRALLKFGVPADKILSGPIPMPHDVVDADSANSVHQSPLTGLAPGFPLHIISAAARIDRFKNLVDLIDAANLLHESGLFVKVILHVGGEGEASSREVLRNRLRHELRDDAIVAPRLPHPEMLALFKQFRSSGLFLFTSCYETLGITPLEAILCGLATLVPDDMERVGVSHIVAEEFRAAPGTTNIARKVLEIVRSGVLKDMGSVQRRQLSIESGPERMVDALELGSLQLTSLPSADMSALMSATY